MFFQINSESEHHSFREIQQSSEGRQIPKLRAFSQVVVNQTIALQTGFRADSRIVSLRWKQCKNALEARLLCPRSRASAAWRQGPKWHFTSQSMKFPPKSIAFLCSEDEADCWFAKTDC